MIDSPNIFPSSPLLQDMYLGKASKVERIADPRTYGLWTDRQIKFTVRGRCMVGGGEGA